MNPEVFKQAQSRGWMEGWEFEREDNHYYMGTLYVFKQVEKGKWLSLNDILFGTNFCEKYFDAFCKYPCCEEALYYGEPKQHQQAMLSMSESERIAFLEKHLEVKGERECNKNGCPVDHDEIKKTQQVELNEIEEISTVTLDSVNGVTTFGKETKNDIVNKINELVDQVNANTKDIAKNEKNCRLNMN